MQNEQLILVGTYKSPFSRLVGLTLLTLEVEFSHEPLAPIVPKEAEKILELNPLGRVPILVCSEQLALRETMVILDWIDEYVGQERALMPCELHKRYIAYNETSLATGIIDRLVTLLYEQWRPAPFKWPEWIARHKHSALRCFQELECIAESWDKCFDRLTRPMLTAFVAMDYGHEICPELMSELSLPRLTCLYDKVKNDPRFSSIYN